jgi:hypothetical protein
MSKSMSPVAAELVGTAPRRDQFVTRGAELFD